MQDLVEKVFSSAKPKTNPDCGQALTGPMLCELADSYVAALNSGSVPTISTAWDRVLEAELRRVHDSACHAMDSFIREELIQEDGKTALPLEEIELRTLI
jgi:hypothetical protein